MTVTSSIVINKPIEKVFAAFSDLDIAEKHISGIKKLELLSGSKKMKKNTKWRETRVMFGKEATEEMWVTAIKKDSYYVVEAESRGTHYISTYTFESKGKNKTEVTVEFEGKPLSFSAKLMSIVGFLFAGSLKKMLHKDMEELKAAIEESST